jgi:N-acetylneuraminic acid mutarotase
MSIIDWLEMMIFGVLCCIGSYCGWDSLYRSAGLKSWNKAKTTGAVPDARHSHTATLMQGKIFIFGGYGTRYLNDVNILNTGISLARHQCVCALQ